MKITRVQERCLYSSKKWVQIYDFTGPEKKIPRSGRLEMKTGVTSSCCDGWPGSCIHKAHCSPESWALRPWALTEFPERLWRCSAETHKGPKNQCPGTATRQDYVSLLSSSCWWGKKDLWPWQCLGGGHFLTKELASFFFVFNLLALVITINSI